MLASARSQSGNALGFGFSTIMSIALLSLNFSTLPVILFSFGAGYFVQLVWNASTGPDFAESQVQRVLDN
ncbi:hypothetical protein WL30_18810 [Burkholderia ubonensis]|uniref:Uncharacterized protein n=2 Tax=Burkholderia ubonensis TaxID=101571 RepID=A0ABD4DWV9_9BURK|nr:hypothetical protein WJ68_28555 [Burkholderia ubonensis]KVN97539.1 hypothetical protein WJ71_27495 [Burkholderia ubonensis]KVO01673.1 hypothetical protein WJ69_29520 [Burkholderia ubonensis]KVO19234.1 hypothetical protein WJ73_03605 [Burkholderia ubonensis]KVO28736.1 hypothetical protein WJ74_24765 [Burkholderia ubonensis]